MPYAQVMLDYEPFANGNPVFVKSTIQFTRISFGKITPAASSTRQQFFEQQLLRLSDSLGSLRLPIYVAWQNTRNRMDKGCIGHAAASGFINQVLESDEGFATHVLLRERQL